MTETHIGVVFGLQQLPLQRKYAMQLYNSPFCNKLKNSMGNCIWVAASFLVCFFVPLLCSQDAYHERDCLSKFSQTADHLLCLQILAHPEHVRSLRVCDLGAGLGKVSFELYGGSTRG